MTSSLVVSQSRSRLGYLKFVASWSGSRLGYLKFCGFADKIPVGIPVLWLFCGWDTSSLWLRGQDNGGNTSSFVASQSRMPQVFGFAVRIRVGITQVLWVRRQEPGWDISSLWFRCQRSRFGYLKFCGFVVKIPVGIPQVCGCVVRIPVGMHHVVGIPQVCGVVVGVPVGIGSQDPGFVVRIEVAIPQVLWIRDQDPGWDTSSFVASLSCSRLGNLKFVASRSRANNIPVGKPQVCGFVVRITVGIHQAPSFVASQTRSRLGYLKFRASVCGFVVEIPVGILQVLWLRGQDPSWDTSSFVRSISRLGYLKFVTSGFVASQSRSRLSRRIYLKLVASRSGSLLGYLKFCCFAVKTPVGIPNFVASWSGSRLGYLKLCGFAVKTPVGIPQVFGCMVRIPVGIPQVLWLRGQEPGWDTSSFSASQAGSRLGYIKFVASQSRSRLDTSIFLASRARSRLGYLKLVVSQSRSRLGHLKFVASWSGFRWVYRKIRGRDPGCIPVGIPQVLWLRCHAPRWDDSKVVAFAVKIPLGIHQVLWLRGQDPGWVNSSFVASWSRSRLVNLKFVTSQTSYRLGSLKFVASWSGSRLGYPKPQVLWIRRQDPGWDTSSLWLCRLGYLTFVGFAVKIPVGIPQACGFAVKIPVGIPQVCGLKFAASLSGSLLGYVKLCGCCGQDPGWDTSNLWLRGQDPGWDTSSFVAFVAKTPTGSIFPVRLLLDHSSPRRDY